MAERPARRLNRSARSRRELLDAFVAEQIISDLRGSKRQAQVARALASLREAHESVDSYRRLYREHGRRSGWPPDGTMRSWLAGSWNDCPLSTWRALVAGRAPADPRVVEVLCRTSGANEIAAG